MLVYPQKVKVYWRNNTRSWYESKGYLWSSQGNLFEVDVNDLKPGSTKKVLFICDEPNCKKYFEMQWRYYKQRTFAQGNSFCSNCRRRSGSPIAMRNKVITEFTNKGYTLLNIGEYENNNSKLYYYCKYHKTKGIQSTTWRSFNVKKNSCHYCKYEMISKLNSGMKPLIRKETNIKVEDNVEYLEQLFSKRGYLLLVNQKIKNTHSKVEYFCLKHYESGKKIIRLNNFLSGVGCKECAVEKSKIKIDYKKLEKLFIKYGATLIEKEHYHNRKQKLKYICNTHKDYGIQQVRLDKLIERKRVPCKICRIEYLKTIKGEKHHNWKGGITKIGEYFRGATEVWRLESLKKGNFKCALTGSSNVVVHHTYPFNKILTEAIVINNLEIQSSISYYTQKDIIKIEKTIHKLHEQYGLGIILDKEAHQIFHKIYGYQYNTAHDFEEFKNYFNQGKNQDIKMHDIYNFIKMTRKENSMKKLHGVILSVLDLKLKRTLQ
ncbi:hypothetical protein [Fictibacillus sp. 18YEL24]|uniref:hypothetical protein n=1 Tax=Fictibacillus sp. 18YEL24 TaxID=2745875 RepID=UPI0018CE835B|nr:hypothetical protein [Fictibacillus sp. 18YEL24]MBH0171287.1 hypothetical protein [Fictibacillus sp. 18YEL24]